MSTNITSERRAELLTIMDNARWPEGFWVQGSSDPPEADEGVVLDAILAALGITVAPPADVAECEIDTTRRHGVHQGLLRNRDGSWSCPGLPESNTA